MLNKIKQKQKKRRKIVFFVETERILNGLKSKTLEEKKCYYRRSVIYNIISKPPHIFLCGILI